MQLTTAAPRVVSIARVRHADDLPLAVEYACFPPHLTTLLDVDLEAGSLHRALRDLGLRHPRLVDPDRRTSRTGRNPLTGAAGVGDYELTDWAGMAGELKESGVAAWLRRVHTAEESDPHGCRWPRTKKHDDKTVVTLDQISR